MFIWYPNLMFLVSPWLEIIDFQASHFADSEQFKVDIYFANIGQVKICHFRTFLLLWTGHCYFTDLGKACYKKQFKPSPFRVSHRCWEHGVGVGALLLHSPHWGRLFKIWWGGEIKSIHGGAWDRLKMLSRNTCEGVHLIVESPAISLQAFKFTKMNFFTHTFQGF